VSGARWPDPSTDLLTTPHGILEYLRTGHGEPVTVFAHGLGNGIADTRPLSSGVPGTRVFFHFRGHGRSSAPGGAWTYADLAADLAAVADRFAAGQALGASLGAAALCRLVAQWPQRFERLVFFMPAVLDEPRSPAAARRWSALRAGGVAARAAIVAEVPEALRGTRAAREYLRARLDQLDRHPLAPGLAALPAQAPVADRTALAAVRAPALVIGCHGDELHPVRVAQRLAESLGNASLHVYPEPGVLWTARADLRRRLGTFLAG
jgi:3-oxoadipate enol-lactonase